MKSRNALMLGGALLLSLPLLAQSVLAQSVLAQPSAPPAQHEPYQDPAEQAHTQGLNTRMQDGITGPPRAADQAEYEAQRQRYERQQQQYQQQRRSYEDQRARYEIQRRAYYEEHGGNPWALPRAAVPAYPASNRLTSLVTLPSPEQNLARAPLVDGAGNWVGRVRKVQTDRMGMATRVQVYLYKDRRNVWIRLGDLGYDGQDGVLFTRLTYRQLLRLPGSSA